MEVKNQIDNKLLGRKELDLYFENSGAQLSRDQIRSQIVKKLKAKEELVVIDSINSTFGSQNFNVTAYIYNKKEEADKITSEHLKKRNEIKAPEVEETTEEAPAEEAAPVAEEPAKEEEVKSE